MSAVLDQGKGLEGELGAAARAIDAEAAELEHAGPVPGAPAPAAQAVNWQAESHDLVDFATGMFFPLYPRLAGVWTPERCATLEHRLAAVLEKYKLDMGTLLGKWGPEIMLAAAIAPAVLPTVKAIREDNAERRAKAKEKVRAAPPPDTPAAPPPPASDRPAAPPDPLKLHEVSKTGESAQAAPPPPDATQLHNLA